MGLGTKFLLGKAPAPRERCLWDISTRGWPPALSPTSPILQPLGTLQPPGFFSPLPAPSTERRLHLLGC